MSNSTEVHPNWLDRAIAFLSPERGVKRLQAKQAYAAYQAAYRGGISHRLSQSWGTSTSYNGQTASDRQQLGNARNRARDIYKRNPVGRSLLKTEVDNVIADGLTLQSKTDSKDFNREAEERWRDWWWGKADIRGMRFGGSLERQIYLGSRRDGDRGLVLVDRGGESRVQLIPADLIQTPDGKYASSNLIDGVEVDAAGKPIGFHILDTDEFGKRKWSRVSAANFIFLPQIEDEDLQVRGETCYMQVFDLLNNLDRYIDGVALAAWMATVFGLIFKEQTAPQQFNLLGTAKNSAGNNQRAITLENGQVRFVGTDSETVQVDAKQPMQQTPDFIRMMMRLIGLPFDMPLELAMKDMSTVNFASARIGLLGYYRAARARQRWFISSCMDRIYRWWISREVKMGLFITAAPEKYWPHSFMPRGWDYTDPVSEVQSDLLQRDMGIKSNAMICAERGRDLEEIQAEQKAEAAFYRMQKLPSVLSSMTRDAASPQDQQQVKPAINPAPPDQTDGEGEDQQDDGEESAQQNP